MTNTEFKDYNSDGKRIRKSAQHTDIFIIEYQDGRFISITSSPDQILARHKPDSSRFDLMPFEKKTVRRVVMQVQKQNPVEQTNYSGRPLRQRSAKYRYSYKRKRA